jgi:hypothetical protein
MCEIKSNLHILVVTRAGTTLMQCLLSHGTPREIAIARKAKPSTELLRLRPYPSSLHCQPGLASATNSGWHTTVQQ